MFAPNLWKVTSIDHRLYDMDNVGVQRRHWSSIFNGRTMQKTKKLHKHGQEKFKAKPYIF